MFALCDCNNFFVSCERVFAPSLNGCAVLVLSSNDGCVIARSNEAKALGIKMGQPFFQIKQLVQIHNIAIFSTNFVLYGDMSNRVMAILRESAPSIEVYSIDEAFMDFSGFKSEDLEHIGRELSRKVRRSTGIPVSIGIAPTKTLAKIASKLCKLYPKLQGACYMHRVEDIEKVLRNTPIEDVWGIGRKYSKMLQGVGIRTAYDFTERPSEWVRQKMSIVGLRTWSELRGVPCLDLETATPDKQQICTSRSFAVELTAFEDIHKAVTTFTVNCAEKLRKQKSICGEINVFIYTNRFRADSPQHYENRVVRLDVPTDSSLELVNYATAAFDKIFTNGYGYKKAGVILSRISPKCGQQASLFDTIDRDKHDRLMKTVDAVNQSQGRGSVLIASQGFDILKMNRNHLSPNYTTSWSDILKIK